MKLAPPDTVPLDRRFERATTADTADYWAEALSDREAPRDWTWLRSRSRVVALLAQAGSGKTVEFMRQVDEQRAAGRDAFFFRVERLCSGPVADAHETLECRARFDAWLRTDRPAEFFLDAVDEAKLPQSRTARPLRDALRELQFALGAHLPRIAAFVSCRSSEWFEEVEQKALDALAVEIGEGAAVAEPITVFNATFAPLDLRRVRLLAADRGGEPAVAVLIENEVIADIVTPLDAILYLDTYNEFAGTSDIAARFASRGQLLDTSVRRRLTEQGGETRRSRLETGTGLKAARFLAFASVVAQTSDLAVGPARHDAIDPQELLASGHAGLSSDGIRQLLACSLFVPSGQARVRFYRREARDMLAAQWLRDRISEGASALAVGDRFIKTAFGEPRVPAAYGSMLAWLASYDPVTRRRVIQAAPHWIIEDGDPRSLALEDRLTALDRHLELGPHRFHGEFVFDVGELRRFAQPELEGAIVGHLRSPPAGDLTDHLMQLVEAGRYASAAPLLVELLKDATRSSGDRMFAVRALIACGDESHLREVAHHLISTGGPAVAADELFSRSRHDHFLLDLVMSAYPRAISVDDALAVLAQLRGKDYAHEAKAIAGWLATTAPAADLERWMVGLDALCFGEPPETYKRFGYDMPPLQSRAKLLLRGLLEVVARYFREVGSRDLQRDLLIYDRVRRADNLGGAFSMSRRGSPVPAALTASATLRQALFDELATVGSRRHTAFAYYESLAWSAYPEDARREDLLWFLERYRSTSGEAREDYAQAALFLVDRVAGRRRWTGRSRIAWTALNRRPPDRLLLREALLEPIIGPWRRRRARRQWARENPDAGIREAIWGAVENTKLRLSIWRNWRALRRGTAVSQLARLVLGDRLEPPSEKEVLRNNGARLGAALIEGTRAFARGYRPVDRGRWVSSADFLAQTGYAFEWSANPSVPGVDAASVLYAALLFATDWPDWATDLARRNAEAWTTLAVPLLVAELASKRVDDPTSHSRFLSTVSHLDDEIRLPLAKPLLDAIEAIAVIEGLDIERVVRILRADPAVEALVPDFARRHARNAWHEGSTRRALNWLPFWAEGDVAGLRTLLDWLKADDDLVPSGLGIYARLYGEKSRTPPAPLELRSGFADLAYSSIRPSDDAPAREGVHSVTDRDNLQHLRSDIGELLGSDFDQLERDALERLLVAHIEPVSPDWANRWRSRYAQQAVKPGRWSHPAISAWAEDLATAPATGDELFARVGEMIEELERELATSDFDRRGLFPPGILESDFRAWLGHALDGRRRSWFSIVQEAETAGSKRTDLRLELRGSGDAVVVVEIKLLHRWTYDELTAKFRSQLVDQYLLTPRIRHGIYLLVDLGRRARSSMADGSTPDGGTLVELINAAAADMSASGGPIARAQLFQIKQTARAARSKRAQAPTGLAAPKRRPEGSHSYADRRTA